MTRVSEPIRLVYNISGEDFTSAGEASSDMKRVMKKLGLSPDLIRRAAICM